MHQIACRIPDIQPRQRTPLPFKLDDYLDRRVVAELRRSVRQAKISIDARLNIKQRQMTILSFLAPAPARKAYSSLRR